jgi:hypothetical protein
MLDGCDSECDARGHGQCSDLSRAISIREQAAGS